MRMDQIANSGNDEFYTPEYAIKPLDKYVTHERFKKVWCPFDTEQSLIVKHFRERGFGVTATHISDGNDFFLMSPPKGTDVIISNPPYSLKGEVFERLFLMGLPIAMIVGVVGLFESQKRFKMFRDNTFEIMYFNKRVAYFKSYDEQKPSLNPPFSSVWITKNILPERIVFEEIEK